MRLLKAVICITALVAAAFPAAAAGTAPYNIGGDNLNWWGTGKSETYDVATFIGPEMKGVQINRVSFYAVSDPEVAGFNIWISSDLRLEEGKNAPDVLTASVEPEDGRVSLAFSEPYTVGDKGVYIGYSFTVAKRETPAQKNPVAIAVGDDSRHGIYVHSSRTYSKWMPSVAGEDSFLPFEMELGGLPEYAVELTLPSQINAGADTETSFVATLTNFGSSPVSSVEVEWSLAGNVGTAPISFSNTLPAVYRSDVPFNITLPPVNNSGEYMLSMKVLSANGMPNANVGTVVEAPLKVWPWLPKRRPLVEAYTSLDCGYCPRTEVGMEKMTVMHGNDFVGVAYHHADVMSILTPEEYPNPAPSQPVAWIDRTMETDVYFGDLPINSKTFGFDEVWRRAASRFTPADLSLACSWTDDSHTAINADANAKFVKAFDDCDFRLSYILVADGITGQGREWKQGNYYSGQTDKWPEDFDRLVNSPGTIQGMVYNQVAILNTTPGGIEGSVPSHIDEGQTVSHSVTLSLADAVNLDKKSLVQDGAALSVVAVLTDARTGETVNCVRTPIGDVGAVAGVEYDTPVAVECFDLLGRRLPCPPQTGIYIEIRRFTDGSSIARRIVAGK